MLDLQIVEKSYEIAAQLDLLRYFYLSINYQISIVTTRKENCPLVMDKFKK